MDTNDILSKLKDLNVAVIAALITGLITLFVAFLNYRNQRKGLIIQENTYLATVTKDQLTKLEKELEEFYRPFNAYLSLNAFLYNQFRAGLPEDFRALLYFIDNNYLFEDNRGGKITAGSLNVSKLALMKNIFDNNEKMMTIIINKGGLVQDKRLNLEYQPSGSVTDIFLKFDPNKPEGLPKKIGLLSLFMVHCELIKLAFEKKLNSTEVQNYSDFVFPRELNDIISENSKTIRDTIDNLNKSLKLPPKK